MPEKLDDELVRNLKPKIVDKKKKVREVRDTTVENLLVRVQPSGSKIYYVTFRRKTRDKTTGELRSKRTRKKIGSAALLSVKEARARARKVLAAVETAKDNHLTGDRVTDQIQRAILGIDKSVDEIEKAAAKIDACPTLEEYIDNEYGPEQERYLKYAANGRETKRLKFLLGLFDDNKLTNLLPMKLTQVSRRNIKEWKARRTDTPLRQTGKPPSVATIQRDLACISGLFSSAIADEYIQINPVSALRARGKKQISAKPNQIVRYLGSKDQTEEKRLLNALEKREEIKRDERQQYNKWAAKRGYPKRPDIPENQYADYFRPLVLTALNTGLRRGELLNLQWKHLRLTTAKTNSTKSKNTHNFIRVPGRLTKNGKPHDLPLNPFITKVLRKWKSQCGTIQQDRYVFEGLNGKRLNSLRAPWKRLLKLAGIKDFRFHDCRHHFASELVMQGEPLNTVREMLNHSDLQMTLRYAHLSGDHKLDAVNRMERDEKKWRV